MASARSIPLHYAGEYRNARSSEEKIKSSLMINDLTTHKTYIKQDGNSNLRPRLNLHLRFLVWKLRPAFGFSPDFSKENGYICQTLVFICVQP